MVQQELEEAIGSEEKDVLLAFANIGLRAKQLNDEGLKYATLRFVHQEGKLMPQVGALIYEGDEHTDDAAPFYVNLLTIGSRFGGVTIHELAKENTEEHESPISSDGAKFNEAHISASNDRIEVMATFLPPGFDMQRQIALHGFDEAYAREIDVHQYMYFGYGYGEIINPGHVPMKALKELANLFDGVLSAIEYKHAKGSKSPSPSLIAAPGEVEVAATIGLTEKSIWPHPFRRLFSTKVH